MIGKTNGGGKDRLRPTIYGGTTRPSNPKNGDFYLYTGTAISATELNGFMSGFPTWTMPEGFVYIGSGGAYNDSSYVNLINVRNGIHNFCPCCCYQVEGGKWYRKDAFVYRTDLLCFFFKYTDKFFTDNLSLCFRFGYAGEFCIETILCVYTDEIQVVWSFRPEYGFYFVAFIFTQKAMVYEYAGELLSDCF